MLRLLLPLLIPAPELRFIVTGQVLCSCPARRGASLSEQGAALHHPVCGETGGQASPLHSCLSSLHSGACKHRKRGSDLAPPSPARL